MKPSSINKFLMFKLPSAYICGVRVRSLDRTTCTVTVKHRWINQNPFKSMFWAVQGMAAELSTGAIVMAQIKKSNKRISMLVTQNKASFTKKAKGKIAFTTYDGALIEQAINDTIETGEGQTVWMRSVGKDEQDNIVSTFDFEWSLKLKG